MGMNFPITPTVGQVFGNYVWDGEKWKIKPPSGGGGGGDPPSDALPLMDGVAAAGVLEEYSRGDHKHPSDTFKEATIAAGTTAQYWRGDKSWQAHDKASVGLSNVDNTSDVNKPVSTAQATADALKVAKAGDTMSGPLIAPVKGNQFGSAAGAGAGTAMPIADANILLYGSGNNWAGIGSDGSGNMWFRTGLSGTPVPAFWVGTDQTVNVPGKITLPGSAKSHLIWGAPTIESSLSADSNGTPSLNLWAMAGTGLTFSNGPIAGSIIQADTLGGFNFMKLPANSTNVAATITASITASGAIAATNDVMAGSSTTNTGVYRFGTNGGAYIYCDGSKYQFGTFGININAGGLTVLGGVQVGVGNPNLVLGGNSAGGGQGIVLRPLGVGNTTNQVIIDNTTLSCPGTILSNGTQCRRGTGGGTGVNFFNFYWNGGAMEVWADTYNPGTIAYTSDYRIKKDVVDLDSKWDVVKALRPIKYTQAEFTPPSQVAYIAKEVLKARKEAEDNPEAKPREVNTGPAYVADDIERWGFVAHELQATMIESASTGVKDAPNVVQSPNPWTIIAALTKVVQELQARVEQLEATR